MLDHVTLKISSLARSTAFYTATLRPLGMSHLYGEADIFAGYGIGQKAFFWISQSATPITGTHVAFTAAIRAVVGAFYEAAIAAGRTDNGPPGLRPHYDEHYYGAFVLDPDGHNIEAVCHTAP